MNKPLLLQAAKEGAVEGWWYGKRFALWAGVVFLLIGPRPFSSLALSFPAVVLLYLAGGLFIGVAASTLTALAPRSRLWRIVVGFIAVFPVALACSAMMIPRSQWDLDLLPTAVGASVILGVGGAIVFMRTLSDS